MAKGDEQRTDVPPYVVLALTPEQIRMLAVYPRVRMVKGELDYRQWARMASLPLARATEIARGLHDMGVLLPGGQLHKSVSGYLTVMTRDRLTR